MVRLRIRWIGIVVMAGALFVSARTASASDSAGFFHVEAQEALDLRIAGLVGPVSSVLVEEAMFDPAKESWGPREKVSYSEYNRLGYRDRNSIIQAGFFSESLIDSNGRPVLVKYYEDDSGAPVAVYAPWPPNSGVYATHTLAGTVLRMNASWNASGDMNPIAPCLRRWL